MSNSRFRDIISELVVQTANTQEGCDDCSRSSCVNCVSSLMTEKGANLIRNVSVLDCLYNGATISPTIVIGVLEELANNGHARIFTDHFPLEKLIKSIGVESVDVDANSLKAVYIRSGGVLALEYANSIDYEEFQDALPNWQLSTRHRPNERTDYEMRQIRLAKFILTTKHAGLYLYNLPPEQRELSKVLIGDDDHFNELLIEGTMKAKMAL